MYIHREGKFVIKRVTRHYNYLMIIITKLLASGPFDLRDEYTYIAESQPDSAKRYTISPFTSYYAAVGGHRFFEHSSLPDPPDLK